MTFNRHYLVVLQVTLIFLCFGLYLMVRSWEEKAYASIHMVDAASPTSAFSVAHSNKPYLLYGTAWKKEQTAKFVSQAVHSGFRFIDTACQPRHYNEPGVGDGWTSAAQDLGLNREDFFLQTKFTPPNGQDHNNMPYDLHDPIPTQVSISLKTSLKNLHTDYLDSWVLHSPYEDGDDTLKAWRAMEEAVDDGMVKQLGISNCYDAEHFKWLYKVAKHKPKVLQNRFYSQTNFDPELRAFCKEHGIKYQTFWTLTINKDALATNEVKQWAEAKGLTPQTYMYAFLMSLGYATPLSGTTSLRHMAEDVAVMERMQNGAVFFETDEELKRFARVLGMDENSL